MTGARTQTRTQISTPTIYCLCAVLPAVPQYSSLCYNEVYDFLWFSIPTYSINPELFLKKIVYPNVYYGLDTVLRVKARKQKRHSHLPWDTSMQVHRHKTTTITTWQMSGQSGTSNSTALSRAMVQHLINYFPYLVCWAMLVLLNAFKCIYSYRLQSSQVPRSQSRKEHRAVRSCILIINQ